MTGLVQLFANFRNALGQQVVGDLALHGLGQDGGCRRHGRVGRGRPHIGQCLRFGERDLAFGGLGAPCDKILHLDFGFGGDAFGLDLRCSNDLLGLAFGSCVARFVFRQ